MDTTEILGRLKELQGILSDKYKFEELVRLSPQQLSNQEELLERLKKQYIEKSAVYDDNRATVAALKAELAQAEINRERGEKGMDDIQSHREYEALAKEIQDAGLMEQRVRKELQKEEKNLAELQEKLTADEQLIEAQESELTTGKTTMAAEIDTYKANIEELKAKEAALVEGIDKEIVFKFERIMKSDRILTSKDKKGIVAVKGNVCDGCHMILPHQFANEVRSGTEIHFCPYCSRVLDNQASELQESEYLPVADAGSLTDFEGELNDFFTDEEDEAEEVEEEVGKEELGDL
jgi:predicted  nucleic acid-binding Zn-ribbon protein